MVALNAARGPFLSPSLGVNSEDEPIRNVFMID